MADSLVSSVLEQLTTLIQEKIVDEVGLVVSVRKEIEKLASDFKNIKDVLNDAEHKQFTEKEGRLKRWLEQVRDVAYDMDDVLDEWNTKIRRSRIEGVDEDDNPGMIAICDKMKKVLSYLCNLSSCFYEIKNEGYFRHDIGSRIVEIRERLDFLKNEKRDYGLIKIKSNERPSKVPIKTTSVLLDDDSNIHCREQEKQTIVSWLVGENSSSLNPTIISIVGMGGLGKTTLAQLVFKADRVQRHFNKSWWVCVSDSFDIVSVAKAIITEAGESAPNSSEWDQELHRRLLKSVEGKHFLLVLDDVWAYDQSIWDRLKSSLVRGQLGCRIVITTRNEEVALRMGTTYLHRLGLLPDDGCLSILDNLLFEWKIKENDFLLEIVTQIAKKCKGLPLTAKVLGGLMRFKKEIDWESVLGSNIWDLEAENADNESVQNESLRPALLLSYYDLSSDLKECFRYCAILPKDYEIERGTMIKMWMAQGFLFSKGNKRELESVGEDYFDQLVMRSLFQDFERDDEGGIVLCKMHDLVHDFALSVSSNLESFTVDVDDKYTNLLTCSSTTRHLTITISTTGMCESLFPPQQNETNYKARTLIMMSRSINWEWDPYLFHRLRCLRVLHLQYVKSSIPDEISEMVHLRFLDLSYGEMQTLPESLTTLYNLQTLILQSCRLLHRLPINIGRMINLRSLIFDVEFDPAFRSSLSYLPQGFKNLTALRNLSKFIVGGDGEACKIGGLQDLNLLRGKLTVRGLENVKSFDEACEAKMYEKKHLQSLVLQFGELSSEAVDYDAILGVIQGLEPPKNLKKLSVVRYLGLRFPTWVMELSLLSHLKLNNCTCTELPALGLLPSLKVLCLVNLRALSRIGPEFCGIIVTDDGRRRHRYSSRISFPKLEKIQIVSMESLEEWDLGVNSRSTSLLQQEKVIVMPRLVSAVIAYCKKLKTISALAYSNCEELEIIGLEKVKQSAVEFFGIDSSDNTPMFPNLKNLTISLVRNLENLGINEQDCSRKIVMMPQLRTLQITHAPHLRILPHHLYRTLTELNIRNCPKLTLGNNENASGPSGPFIFPHVEKLKLSGPAGVLHTSLWLFPNLKVLEMVDIPVALKFLNFPQDTTTQLQWLRYIKFDRCPFCTLGFGEEVKYLPGLQELHFVYCLSDHSQEAKDIKSRTPNFICYYKMIHDKDQDEE